MHQVEITEENKTEVSTDELARFYYHSKNDVKHAAQCYANAKSMDISSYKVDNALNNWKADKARTNLILKELLARGVKKTSPNGGWS